MSLENRLPVSIVIPTFNMAAHLDKLLSSLKASSLTDSVCEIIVVNDGSTDATSEVVKKWPGVREIKFDVNRGRFWARFAGAESVQTEKILFLDTRLSIGSEFLAGLKKATENGGSAVGWVDIDISKNVFCLYWKRSHEYIFSHHFAHRESGAELTLENYDDFLKGTGVFLCGRRDFVEVCSELKDLDTKSDDTLLMKKLISKNRMFIDPNMVILWEPRDSYRDFLWRIVDRGPGFIEYHVLQQRGLFFYVSLVMLLASVLWLAALFTYPLVSGAIALMVLVGLALSAGLFAKSLGEWLKIAILHVLVTLSFVVGLFYGLLFHFKRKLGLGEVRA